MKKLPQCLFVMLLAAGLLALGTGTATAGGLVDTGPAAFDAAIFTDSEHITNPWWTLGPDDGYHNYLYFAEDDGECEWNLMEVLAVGDEEGEGWYTHNFDAPYSGVRARIVLDRAWVEEDCEYDEEPDAEDFLAFMDTEPEPEPEESTYDWFAQDEDGNIWYMGEDTWDGESNEGSFVAGCDDAEAGIVMLGDPHNGDFYSQEFYEGEAEDWGKVLNFMLDDEDVCMMTKEWTPLEPGHIEHKIYCSDGEAGELAVIHELKGKTVVVELVGTDVDWDGQEVTGEIDPEPQCDA